MTFSEKATKKEIFFKVIATIFLALIFSVFFFFLSVFGFIIDIIVENLALGHWWFLLTYPFTSFIGYDSINFLFIIFFFLFLALVSALFYYKKEKLLLKIAIIVLLVWLLGGGLGGKILSDEYSKSKINFENQTVFFTQQAGQTKDPKICEEINKLAEKEIEKHQLLSYFFWNLSVKKYNFCVIKTALNLNNIDVCNEFFADLISAKERCLTHFAVKRRDVTICRQIKYETDNCVFLVANRLSAPELCDLLKNYSQENCRELVQQTKIAFERKDFQECLNYESYSGVPYLDKRCVSELAFKMKNQELCKLLEYELAIEDCLLQFED